MGQKFKKGGNASYSYKDPWQWLYWRNESWTNISIPKEHQINTWDYKITLTSLWMLFKIILKENVRNLAKKHEPKI